VSCHLTVTDVTLYFLVQVTHLHICRYRDCVMFPSKPAFKINLVLHYFWCCLHKEGVSLCFLSLRCSPSAWVTPYPGTPQGGYTGGEVDRSFFQLHVARRVHRRVTLDSRGPAQWDAIHALAANLTGDWTITIINNNNGTLCSVFYINS